MPKLTVRLKQMTPMIHFQADEDGATLRASELKPKLDRYLMTYVFKKDRQEYAKFLIGAGSGQKKEGEMPDALDYRVRINAPGDHVVKLFAVDEKNRIKPKGSIWFKDEQDFKQWGSFSEDVVEVVFLSKHQGVIKAIEEWIGPFFAVTNFGFRQSKGFGSFLPIECANKKEAYEECLRKHLSLNGNEDKKTKPFALRFGACNGFQSNWEKALNDVCDIWQAIRSGINRGQNKYTPSFLMKQYATRMCPSLSRFNNEKKLMKKRLLQGLEGRGDDVGQFEVCGYTGGNNRLHAFHDGGVYKYDNAQFGTRELLEEKNGRFMRAMLGLSTFVEFNQIEFRDKNKNFNFKKKVRINISGPVERFKSPLTFKPVCFGNQWFYYLIPDSIPEAMLNKKFTFIPEIVAKDYTVDSSKKMTLSTPESFDLMDFLHALYSFYSQGIMYLKAVQKEFTVQEVKTNG